MTDDTRAKLIRAAAALFREHGYNGTGVAEVLNRAGVTKGSLYHHFPGGKADLAVASAHWAGAWLTKQVNESFARTDTMATGIEALCDAIAELFDRTTWTACPINSTLLDGATNEPFQAAAGEIFENWRAVFGKHAMRYGADHHTAQVQADKLLFMLEGAWIVARAQGRSDPLRKIPSLLAG